MLIILTEGIAADSVFTSLQLLSAGPSKMQKADELSLKVIDEDGLFDLIRTRKSQPFQGRERHSFPCIEVEKLVQCFESCFGVA